KRMGKRRIVAATGAGQHGVATAAACALLGLECIVYMGTDDVRRQHPNVFRMKLLGAEVREVDAGSRTLKDAINEAIRDWVTNVRTTYYLLGSVVGPHPYPAMVREFQSVIGREARAQHLERVGKSPDVVVACVGGGSKLRWRTEGTTPALEPAHAIADLTHIRDEHGREIDVLVCLSGRGDKDLDTVMERLA